ncbi:MAG: ABC transporter ATP-binding protein [Clostridia bacterium]|jgi:peptide/nickel transport system ATP-binding protein/oligopeptide transport system ATP-binding protein|nr:ABC transporter ATP-binding protein [Clostridia bacterium]
MVETTETVLEVKNLSTSFFLREGEVKAVDDVSFHINKGEVLAILGESGSGKTVTALSLLRLISWPPGKIKAGSVNLNGQEILNLPLSKMRKLRGRGIAMILQEPMSSLNPSQTIGSQIMEAVQINQGLFGEEAQKKAVDMLNIVRIPSPEKRFYNYPHELSGGMKQRIMIAIALSCRPKLLIADEPTCSLDVTIQAQILKLMKQLRSEIDMTILFITSDLGIVSEMADRVAVMYAGKMIEITDVFTTFEKPAHPYTRGVMGSIMAMKAGGRLNIIPGDPPNLMNLPAGCKFHPRCEYCRDICKDEEPHYTDLNGDGSHFVSCHFPLGGRR